MLDSAEAPIQDELCGVGKMGPLMRMTIVAALVASLLAVGAPAVARDDAPQGLDALIGTWKLTGDSPVGTLEHELVVEADGSATYESSGQVSEVRNLEVDGDEVAFEMTVYGGHNSYEMTFAGRVDEAGLEGELLGSSGSFATLTAARE